MKILGIETTCDETAAAVVTLGEDERGQILANEVLSQIAEHAAYGGVVPEIAARAHVEVLDRLIARALQRAGTTLKEIDGIAVAAGPGLIGGVLIGLVTAKTLALVARKPLLAVNHLEAHALTPRLTDGLAFPYLLLLASGGHCQLLEVRGVWRLPAPGYDDRRCRWRSIRQSGEIDGAGLSRRSGHRSARHRR